MIQIEKKFPALGTVNTISLYGKEEQKERLLQLAEEVRVYVLEMDDKLSLFKQDSEISQLNRLAGKQGMIVSEEVWELLQLAEEYRIRTEGRFDVTSGVLCQLWRNARKSGKLPCKEEIKQAGKQADDQQISFSRRRRRVKLKEKGISMDLGAIAKGYLLEKVQEKIRGAGVEKACLNFGGSVCVIGKEQLVGIQDPRKETGESFGRISICDQSVVTSGIYEQCLEIEGKTYHHIIDSITGYPIENEIASVTVIGQDAAKLDALATCIVLCGIEKGMELAREDEAECIFVMRNADVFSTAGVSIIRK